MLVRTDMDVNE